MGTTSTLPGARTSVVPLQPTTVAPPLAAGQDGEAVRVGEADGDDDAVRVGEAVRLGEADGDGEAVRVALVPMVGAGVGEAVPDGVDEGVVDGVGEAEAARHTPAAHISVALRQHVQTGGPVAPVQQQNCVASEHSVTESSQRAARAPWTARRSSRRPGCIAKESIYNNGGGR